MRKLFAGLMAAAALAVVAEAAPDLEVSIAQCAAKPDAKDRLACYDGIAHRLKAGEIVRAPAPMAAAPSAVPAQQQTVAQFGAESLTKKNRVGQPEPLEGIQGKISRLELTPNGRAIITLDIGQVWRQIDADTQPFRGKQGDTVTIKRAIFGSYSLTVEGHNLLIKVQRVR